MLDYITLFEDYGVDYATEGPNVGNNYIGIMCPWCGDTSYHGGVPKKVHINFHAGDVVGTHLNPPYQD